MWKIVEGYRWPYRINENAVVQHLCDDGVTWKEVHPWPQRTTGNYGRMVFRVSYGPKHNGLAILTDWMAEQFMGGKAAHPGMVVLHKNSSVNDCALCNLKWGTRQEVGQRYGGNGRRAILKIDKAHNVVEIFRSTVDCCKHEHISRKALWYRTTNKIKEADAYLLTGYTYAYEDSSNIQKNAKRKKAHFNGNGIDLKN
jgi:hypothetical protein